VPVLLREGAEAEEAEGFPVRSSRSLSRRGRIQAGRDPAQREDDRPTRSSSSPAAAGAGRVGSEEVHRTSSND